MTAEPERALVGVEDIAAFTEIWWREQGRRGVRVSARTVRRWIRHATDPLPASRIDLGGPWTAVPSEVRVWLARHLLISTRMSAPAPIARRG